MDYNGKYDGKIVGRKAHGYGTYTWANGDKYNGQYKNDKKHGKGTYIYADKSSLE
jgi:hypothetical protein|tara:strand:- start:333 stop:497 length:165 start_codon:yes stop_codon:yes gene_type:complete